MACRGAEEHVALESEKCFGPRRGRVRWHCLVCPVALGQEQEGASCEGSGLPTASEEINSGVRLVENIHILT